MKSIAIGINIFDNFKRQDLCIDSLKRVKDKCDNVTLYNIQQAGQKSPIIHPDFETIYDKGRTAANTIEDCTMQMPIVNDFFDALCLTGKDYFVFLNSDIILSRKVIRLINECEYDSICFSRLAINEIDSLEDQNISHSHFQIAGFDVYAVRTKWWEENRHMFPDYIYAISAWDVDFASRLMVLGKSKFDTEFPPGCYHIIHPEKAHDDTPERRYNMDLFFNKNKSLCDAWHKYLFETIERRKKLCPNYTKVADGELELIQNIFKNEDLHSFCRES